MSVKKIGKAKAESETGLWGVEGRPERFTMDLRLVNLRPDVKALKAVYSKHAGKIPPSRRHIEVREKHFELQKDIKAELLKLLKQVYAEILEESFSYPVLLRKDRDFDHKSDWRYGLYQGIVYQFDKPDYQGDAMIEEIRKYQDRQVKA